MTVPGIVTSTADSGPGTLRQVLWRQCFSQADRLPQSFFVICGFEFSAHARSLPSHCHNHSLPDLSGKLLAARYTNREDSVIIFGVIKPSENRFWWSKQCLEEL